MSLAPFNQLHRKCARCKAYKPVRGGKMRKVRAVRGGAVTAFTCAECA